MSEQEQAARQAMGEWLADGHELGRWPAKLECVNEFDLHDMHYYIFRYKKGLLGPWLLGVCGGYEGESLEHCGHVFSDRKPYDEANALQNATAMVERIRDYWKQRAAQMTAQQAEDDAPVQ